MNSQLILKPIITEKSMKLASTGVYMFETNSLANKLLVADAVAKQFKVKVESVRIANLKGKPVRFRGKKGVRKTQKRAYVNLANGQKIDAFEETK